MLAGRLPVLELSGTESVVLTLRVGTFVARSVTSTL